MPISKPSVTLNIIPAQQAISNQPQRVLFVGQKTGGGTAVAGSLVTNIENNGQENVLFGPKSMIAAMIRAAKVINKQSRFDAICLDDDGAAVKATGSIAFGGTPTGTGTVYITIGSTQNHRYTLDYTSADTVTIIGGRLATLINADPKAPVTAVNTAGSVALTAVNAGPEGNKIGLRIEGKISSVTTTITVMSGGTGLPNLTGLFDVINNQRYQTIVYPSSYSTPILINMLDARFNVSNNVLDGVGVMCIYDTFANLKTAGNLLNSQSIVLLGIYKVDEADFKGQAILEMPTVIASEFAAVRALRLTHNANLALYVPGTTNGARDSFGGPALASMPYFNTPFYELPISTLKHEFTDEEQTELNTTGISLLDNNTANNRVIAGEVVTTYKTDFGGNPDHTYKYLNAVDTASNIREYFFNNLKAKYAQTRLTQGDLVPNRNMANAESIKAYLVGLYTDLSGENYVLTQAGEAARKFFIDNCTVEIDMEEGQVTIIMKTPIVVQLRSIIATMQIAFSTQG